MELFANKKITENIHFWNNGLKSVVMESDLHFEIHLRKITKSFYYHDKII